MTMAWATKPNRKYLTRDNLHVYARVPSVDIGGVIFESSDGRLRKEGQRVVDPDVFGSEIIPYTFRLEEALAATNLPAWPGIVDENTSIFESVTLRYSTDGLDGRYTEYPMHRVVGQNGIVWETEGIGITPGNNHYYFDVTLTDPITLEILDLKKIEGLGEALGSPPTLSDVIHATSTHTIEKWSMPDPRNLQLADRGILELLFQGEVQAELSNPALWASLASGQIPSGKELEKLRNTLQINAFKVLNQFTDAFDSQLVSVFSVPKIDTTSQSIWVADFTDIDEGSYFLSATVYDADRNPLDLMQGEFVVDTEAPKADIEIAAEKSIEMGADKATNTVGYLNRDGVEDVYVATVLDPDAAATLNITGVPTSGGPVVEGHGYLIYQIIGLNEDGTPYGGDPSLERPNTWMPLTIESTMLASTVWDQLREQLPGLGIEIPSELNLPLDAVQGLLDVLITPAGAALLDTQAPEINEALQTVGDLLGVRLDLADQGTRQLLVDVLGSAIEIVNAVPITYGDNNVQMPIQGADGKMPLLTGHYGIRAMGIDTLFNVSSHTAPTRLTIVDSNDPAQMNSASVTLASIGDRNGDGVVDDKYEHGTIYANTTQGVELTITIDKHPHPLAGIMVQYQDADGDWQPIGMLSADELDGTQVGAEFSVMWDVPDTAFAALVGSGNVIVRAVATNKLEIDDAEPMTHTIKLDPGVYPPEVLDIKVDEASITSRNADSGAPKGTITINAETEPLTGPKTVRVRFEATQGDGEPIELGTVDSIVDAIGNAVNAAVEGADATIDTSSQTMWSLEVDTMELLPDTITKDSPAARDASKDENYYTIRAFAVSEDGTEWPSDKTAMLSVDNVDDVAPLGPTGISVTSVDGVDVVFETSEDGNSFTVGGLVDKYDDDVASPVATITIEPVAERGTYESIKFTTDPDLEGLVIGEPTETAEGSGVFTVTFDVGTLADGETYLEDGTTYTFQALAVDESDNVEDDTDDTKISVTVENTYRPAPEVLAIAVDPESITQTNPDSGAPQGNITIKTRSHDITSPPTSSMLVEVKRPGDEEWIDVGTATESMLVSDVSDAELADFVDDVAALTVNAAEASDGGEATVVSVDPSQTHREWMLEVDTTTLEDTIAIANVDNIDAIRDASKDSNQYQVRVTAIAEYNESVISETLSADGITAHFSVDNVDDVPPVGPTNITAVADVAGMIEANEDGSYTISNIVDDTLPPPTAKFTIEQTADPKTYEGGSVNLVQTTEDGTETTTESEPGVLNTIEIDIGTHANGTYMFHALTVDKEGNVQTDESPKITVHVLNFRVTDVTDIAVIAVDGTDVADAPAEPISLRQSVTVSFMVANGSLAAEELSGAVAEQDMPSESADGPENTFTLMVEVGALADGIYSPNAVVTKRNGSVEFPVAEVNVDNTGPMIMIESPTDGEAVENLPTVHATYNDGEGSGTDKDGQEVLPWATTELADGPTVAITRLQPEQGNTDVEVDQDAIETDNGTLVYTRTEQLPGGAYNITVQVADVLGNIGTASREFVINGTAPAVAIHSPAPGQTFDHGQPLISGEFSGTGEVEVTTFTVNDADAEPEVDGNQFSYTPEEALTNDNYMVVVEVTDGDGNTARTTTTFVVDIPEPPKDTTPPVISAVAPNGVIKDSDSGKLGAVVISAVVTDEQSAVSSVKYSVNGGQLQSISNLHINEGKIQAPVNYEAHGDGLYTVRLVATSEGGTTEITWTFTLLVDNVAPTITSITPSGIFRGGLPVISASANDESGVAEMSIVVMDSDGDEVDGETQDDGESDVSGITRLDFNPAEPLEEGVYTIEVRATDPYSNSASAKGSFTIDFDTAAPIITMASPANNARLMYAEGEERRPTIAISYADAESGVDADSIRFVFNDQLITLTPQQKSASQVTYKPTNDLEAGQYSVKLEVSDRANQEGNVSDKTKGAREANTAVYQFTFSVELKDGPILASRPLNYPNPFKDNTRISFTLARQATVSIVIYDATLRPVRVLVDNQVLDAGNYTRKDNGSDAIGWDGKSSSGEDLARGIYFCEIIVADGFEPEYAILKLALTR